MNGSKILLKTLKMHGVKTIFGIVGREAGVIQFNEVDGIEFVLTRDERNAAFMADMQGRLTGKAGICYSTFGPGATNLTTGIASAYADRSPMLAISAQVEQNTVHCSTHQYVDQCAIMRPITKYAYEIKHIDELSEQITKAITIAEQGIPGPCFLSIPLDIFLQEKQAVNIVKTYFKLEQKDPREVKAINIQENRKKFFQLFQQSVSPICIVGGGIKAEEIVFLRKFLLQTGSQAVTTYCGKGIISDDEQFCFGSISKYLHNLSPGFLEALFTDADLIILIGVDMVEGLSPDIWNYGQKKSVCAINSNLNNNCDFISLNGEVKVEYSELLEKLFADHKKPFYKLRQINQKKKYLAQIKEQAFKTETKLGPYKIISSLNKILSAEDIVISDVGLHKQFVSLYYLSKKAKRFFCSNGLGSMGFGLPAALGAKKTCPDKNVIVVCGDGGFHCSSHDLETSIRFNLPVICIVFCDNSVGLIRYYQSERHVEANTAITDFGPVDFVKIAQANGCKGYWINSEKQFNEKLKESLKEKVTVVLALNISKKIYNLMSG